VEAPLIVTSVISGIDAGVSSGTLRDAPHSVKVSLVLCAHNSRPDFLARVINSCLAQDACRGEEEILLVDSGSTAPLVVPGECQKAIRITRESEPGLARARAAGIRETQGDVIVFVDDDTVLARDYVAVARTLLDVYPLLGALGGQLIPEFDGALPLPERYYWERLALRRFCGAHWSNRWDDFTTSPIGGGMVVRRVVADEWARRYAATPWRHSLGRRSGALSGGEDVDLLHTACEMGFGKGIFDSLELTHLVTRERLTPGFLTRITEGNARSWAYLRGMLDPQLPMPPRRLPYKIRVVVEAARKHGLDRDLYLAEHRGLWQGWQAVMEERERLRDGVSA
jgi:Glycosyl transferase family 2